MATVPRNPAPKRSRKSGSKNLKKHEWTLIHQHLLRRIKKNKDTVFIIHGVKHDWHNVHRKILRASTEQVEPLGDSVSLPYLPSYIALRSPSPELSPVSQIDFTDSGPTLVSVPQQAQQAQQTDELPKPIEQKKRHTTSSEQGPSLTSEDPELDTKIACDVLLRNLVLSDVFQTFRNSHESESEMSVACYTRSFGLVHARSEDTLEAFVNRLCNSGYLERGMSYLDIVHLVVRKGDVLISHFLETVVRKVQGRHVAILKWLADGIDMSKFGARAMGTAAYRNNFEAVDMLLDLGVDINSTVFGPHSHPVCRCQINIIAYAQTACFEGEGAGASDKMILHLLARGAKWTGANVLLLGLLGCAIRQQGRETGYGLFRSHVQSIVRQTHGLTNFMCETESILETCILESEWEYDETRRLRVLKGFLEQGIKTSLGSPLAALLYVNEFSSLIEMVLAQIRNINAYCNSVNLNDRSEKIPMRPAPYNKLKFVSPLQAAALHGKENIIRFLLRKGADINCPARGPCGVTPLQGICFQGFTVFGRALNIRTVKLLVDRGANVNAAPAWKLGLSALQAAAFVGDVKIAKLLVSHGADVNAPACKYGGGTALALAARQGHVDMVRFLLKAGAVVPDAGVEISSLGVTYEDHKLILDLLHISALELAAMGGDGCTISRDYHEYEAEWANDPTYEKDR